MTENITALILIGIALGLGVVALVYILVYMMRKMMRKFEDGIKEIGDNLEKIGEKVETIGKIFTGLAIGLVKASKEKRSLTGKDLAEGLKMAEESKTSQELLEKLSRKELPASTNSQP